MKERYDPRLRQTENGKRLYYCWKTVRQGQHPPEWDFFPCFYDWAVSSGYKPGDRLRLIDSKKPYSPENCTWKRKPTEENISQARADEWNRVVNRLRKQFGMESLEGTEYGNN